MKKNYLTLILAIAGYCSYAQSPTGSELAIFARKTFINAVSPVFYSSVTGTISSQPASATQNGHLLSTDWSIFNNKQPALNGTGILSFIGTVPTYNTTSAGIASIISDKTGTGSLVFNNSPTFVTPVLGAASATSLNINGVGSYATTIVSAGNYQLGFTNGNGHSVFFGSFPLTANRTITLPDLNATMATINGGQTFISATWNAGIIGATYGGTGTGTPGIAAFNNITGYTATGATGSTGGNLVFDTSPTLITPNLGTPSTLVGTNITGTAPGLTAGSVATNANLTGPIISVGNATSVAAQTGTGSTFVMNTAPTINTSLSTPLIFNGSSSASTLTLKNNSGASLSYVIDANGMTAGNVAGVSSPNTLFKGENLVVDPVSTPRDFYATSQYYASTATNYSDPAGVATSPNISSLNTQNWTRGLTGLIANPAILAGATGTINYIIGLQSRNVGNSSTTATLTNAVGVNIDSFVGTIGNSTYLLTGTTAFATGNWNMYSNTAFNNYMGTGNTQIGSSAPTAGAEKLQVTGTASISSSLLLGGTLTGTNASFAGNLGIGTTTPAAQLDISGTILHGGSSANLGAPGSISFIENSGKMLTGWNRSASEGETDFISNQGLGTSGGFSFYNHDNSGNETQLIRVKGDGNVGIGWAYPDAKLAVNGTIHSREVKIDLTNFPDYVFKPTYTLPSLNEVKTYIDQNHHLPEMPSEDEVVQNGVNLGEMVKLQTKKIEELTLYLIDQDKQMKAQQKINESLQQQINQLVKKLDN